MYCLTGLALLSAEPSASQRWNIESGEEYGNVYVTLDIDEVNALIASMAMLEQIGVAVSVPVAIGGSLADSAGFYRCVDGVPLLTRRTCLCLDWP